MVPNLEYRSTTKEVLLNKYIDENWAERLRLGVSSGELQYNTWPCGNFKRGHKWLNKQRIVVCLMFEHQNPSRPGTVVQELNDGKVHWYDEGRGSPVTAETPVADKRIPVYDGDE
jgi:hypothetical protein